MASRRTGAAKTCALIVVILLTPPLTASFENRAYRAASAHMMFRRLHQHFDKARSVSAWCSTIVPANSLLLGENDVNEGKPVLNDPSAPFLMWVFICAGEYFRDDFSRRSTDADLDRYLSARTFAQLKDFAAASPSSGLDASSRLSVLKAGWWGRLPAASQQAIATDLVHALIGPGVVADEGAYVRELVALADRTPDVPVIEAEQSMVLKIIGSTEFINY